MDFSNVVPRVIPIFLHEVLHTAPTLRAVHFEHFLDHLPSILITSNVIEEDLQDLIITVISLSQKDSAYELPPGGDPPLAFLIVRLLAAMFDLRNIFAARCYRALKHLVLRILRKLQPDPLLSETAIGGRDHVASQSIEQISPVRPTLPDEEDSMVVCSADGNISSALFMDKLVAHDATRHLTIQLWALWDCGSIDVSLFTSSPETLHHVLPMRRTSKLKVFRDFAFCTQRPKLSKQWGTVSVVHIKTNIKAMSEVMYRILVEGYNYGINSVLFSDVVGYTNRNWDEIGNMTKFGWPEGWDSETCNDYAPGAVISQYFSSDRFVTVRLKAKSFFCVGFGVSAWLVFHGMGEGFPISVTIHHQDEDL